MSKRQGTGVKFHKKEREQRKALTIRHGRHAPTMPTPISATVTNQGSNRLLVRSTLCLK